MKSYSGITSSTVNNIISSAGIVYFNIDLSDLDAGDTADALTAGTILGATKGGNTFNPGRTMRHIEADGLLGPTKGFQRRTEVAPVLSVNGLEISAKNIIKAMAGATGVDTTGTTNKWQKITGDEVKPASYIGNVALVTYNQNSSGAIAPIAIFVIKNALALDAPNFGTQDNDEMVLNIDFAGHFDPESPGVEPWVIYHRDLVGGS